MVMVIGMELPFHFLVRDTYCPPYGYMSYYLQLFFLITLSHSISRVKADIYATVGSNNIILVR
jgi:hypothetical protein